MRLQLRLHLLLYMAEVGSHSAVFVVAARSLAVPSNLDAHEAGGGGAAGQRSC